MKFELCHLIQLPAHEDMLCIKAKKISRILQTVENLISSSDRIVCIDKTFVNTNLITNTDTNVSSSIEIITIEDSQSLVLIFETIPCSSNISSSLFTFSQKGHMAHLYPCGRLAYCFFRSCNILIPRMQPTLCSKFQHS
ncbi:hypothetical protein CEXT_437111 [Caerostris extrusa]|uniref:Uncharacterized protein n=1 Tax=Caerostris extrusa TaxID=172846 RepID=A0AAV4RBY3_CAEEX|nr:hypothetical protein CEXT_437111 [Caerostris extrusa]